MKYIPSLRILNLFFRISTIALKFVLSVLVIKYLSIEEYGILGLFQSTVIIMSFVLGFDFYAYSSREILKDGAKEIGYYLKNQFSFHFISYLCAIPLCYVIYIIGIIDLKFLVIFYFILIFEHFSQELYRLLIIIKKTVPATIVLFFRSGFWVAVLYFLWNFQFVKPSLPSIFYLWLLGAFVSILFALSKIKLTWMHKTDMLWIKKGLVIALPFFIGTILYKLMEFSGRYFLSFYYSDQEVGVFTFYSGVSNILFVFVQTLVIIEHYPELLESKNKGRVYFLEKLKTFKNQIFLFACLGTIISLILIYPFLIFLDKEVLFKNIWSYIILLISNLIFCFSFISHYALYSYNKDGSILKATTFAFLINIIISFCLVPSYGIIGASLSQFAGYLALYLGKMFIWKGMKL